MMAVVILTLLFSGIAFCVGLGQAMSRGILGLKLGAALAGGLSLMAVLRLLQAASHPNSPRVEGDVAWALVVLVPALILWCSLLLGYEVWVQRQERPPEALEGPGLNPVVLGG